MSDELRSRLEECQIGIASRGQKQPDDTFLSPHLWEQLRQRLQGIYRRATGEPLATLSVNLSPTIPSAAPLHWYRPPEVHGTVVLERAATRFGTFEAWGGGGCYLGSTRLDQNDDERSLAGAKVAAARHYAKRLGEPPSPVSREVGSHE
jgi:hypothetical protein